MPQRVILHSLPSTDGVRPGSDPDDGSDTCAPFWQPRLLSVALERHPLPLAERGACQIFDASRTRFFVLDADTRGITAVASLPGRFFVGEEPHGSWLAGWYQSGPLAV